MNVEFLMQATDNTVEVTGKGKRKGSKAKSPKPKRVRVKKKSQSDNYGMGGRGIAVTFQEYMQAMQRALVLANRANPFADDDEDEEREGDYFGGGAHLLNHLLHRGGGFAPTANPGRIGTVRTGSMFARNAAGSSSANPVNLMDDDDGGGPAAQTATSSSSSGGGGRDAPVVIDLADDDR